MITRDLLSQYLQDLLAINSIKDYCVNGLQVQGTESINTIVTAVTASKDAIEFAIDNNADALIVHHGYFWNNDNPAIIGMQYKRISKLINNNLNLFAYHLPLDLHKTLGNNVLLAQKLGLQNIAYFETLKTKDLLCSGSLREPTSVELFATTIQNALQRKPFSISHNPQKLITKIALCTGGAADAVIDAHSIGADAFITGEIAERTYYQALELDIAVFAAGHHATEKFGVQALGLHLADRFAVQHLFYDSHNPL